MGVDNRQKSEKFFLKKQKEEREASGGGFGDMSQPDTAHTAEEQNMERLLEEPAEPALTWEDPELTAQEKVLHGLHLVEFFAGSGSLPTFFVNTGPL